MHVVKLMLEDAYDEGYEVGFKIGREIAAGESSMLVSLIKKKLEKGNTPEEIADIFEEDVELIRGIVKEITE